MLKTVVLLHTIMEIVMHYHSKSLGSVRFFFLKKLLLFCKDVLNCLKVAVKTFIVFQINTVLF